jgi:hypothetical protein
MFNPLMFVYIAVLFFVLTPGVLLSLPPKSSKLVVAATHAVVFALVFHLTYKVVWKMVQKMESFQGGSGPMMPAAKKMAGSA